MAVITDVQAQGTDSVCQGPPRPGPMHLGRVLNRPVWERQSMDFMGRRMDWTVKNFNFSWLTVGRSLQSLVKMVNHSDLELSNSKAMFLIKVKD